MSCRFDGLPIYSVDGARRICSCLLAVLPRVSKFGVKILLAMLTLSRDGEYLLSAVRTRRRVLLLATVNTSSSVNKRAVFHVPWCLTQDRDLKLLFFRDQDLVFMEPQRSTA
jgi:hypothetical protein